ncbi:MAG: hypothetical protein JWP89_2826 [Schlesneria sp.]|nr:hypothetical protein [Schlesneria sp.]
MKDFFHGWRRKIGYVTLALALALAAIWVRSTRIDDAIRFTIADRTNLLRSSERGLHWYAWDKKWTVATPTWTSHIFLEMTSEWDFVQWRKDFALDGCHPDLTTIFFC